MAGKIKPTILLRYGKINEPVRIPIDSLLMDKIETFLISDSPSATTTFSVKNVSSIGTSNIILVGDVGNEGSEIIYSHNSTAPNATTNVITLSSNTIFPHSSGTYLNVLKFDQIEITNAQNTTPTGTTLVALVSILADDETTYNDTVNTTGYYFARFKNSISGAFSPYSDAAPLGGYTITSARSVIDNALGMINKEPAKALSDEFLFREINNCQMEVLREFKRWSFMQKFDQIIGQTVQGTWTIALPTDIDNTDTTKSIYNFRIGKEQSMKWVDKEDFNNIVSGFAYSTLAQPINVGTTSVILTSSTDFDDSGTITAGSTTITYTQNNRSTNTLTIGASGTTVASGTDVFLNGVTGNPEVFTVYAGNIKHWPITSSSYKNRNYYLDYYSAPTSITKDSDNIILPDPTVIQYYLAWKTLLKINNGEATPASDSMYNNYITRREKMKQKESLNREFILTPRSGNRSFGRDNRYIRTQGFWTDLK